MSIFTSILTAGTNSHQETSENVNAVATDFVSQGVIGAITNTSGVAPSTGAFAVNAQGTPNMTVAVSSGVAYVTATPTSQDSQTLRVRNTASANVTISANSSGSTKYDWIYIQIDASKAANPAVDASDVATLVVSRSSSSTTDNGTPPTYGYNIAVVTVANSASSITNGNITDRRIPATFRSSPATNAVNNVDIASAATGSGPTISAVGTDTNIDLNFAAKGTGKLKGIVNNLYNPYKFSVYCSTSPALTANSVTKVPLDTKITPGFDTGSNFDATTNYRFTAPIAGFYFFSARATVGSAGIASTAWVECYLFKNGAEYSRGQQIQGSSNSNLIPSPQIAEFMQLAANDYIELWVQTSDTGRSVVGGNNYTFLRGFLVSAT